MIKKTTIKSGISFVILAALIIKSVHLVDTTTTAINETQLLDSDSTIDQSKSVQKQPKASYVAVVSGREKLEDYWGANLLQGVEIEIINKNDKHLLNIKFDDTLIEKLTHSTHANRTVTLNVEYQILYYPPSRVILDGLCDDHNHHAISTLRGFSREDLEIECRAELFTGGAVDEKNMEWCRSRRLTTNIKLTQDFMVELEHLLPAQLHEINITMHWADSIQTNTKTSPLTKYHCAAESQPWAPPLADLSSFEYVNATLLAKKLNNKSEADALILNLVERLGKDQELVYLYWRQLPHIFAGSSIFDYYGRCKYLNYSDNKPFKFNSTISKMLVDKPINAELDCLIYSRNNHGMSKDYTRIMVPKRVNFIDLGERFKMLAQEVSHNQYRIEWTPFKYHWNATTTGSAPYVEILAKNSLEAAAGSLVLHWCSVDELGDCHYLDGTTKLGDTAIATASYNLQLPNDILVKHRRFGLSYMWKSGVSSGIVWSKCLAISKMMVDREPQPMKLIESIIEAGPNDKRLLISWSFHQCDPIVFKIYAYEFNYCSRPKSEICSFFWGQSGKADPLEFDFSKNDGGCVTRRLVNNFSENETLFRIEPQAKYFVRARYIMADGVASAWSTPITFPAHDMCGLSWWAYIWIPVLLAMGAALFWKGSSWYDYFKSILYRFKNTRANLSESVDMKRKLESELMTRKYCINRETIDLAGELSVDMLEHMDSLASNYADDGQHNSNDQSFDYIPRNLIENNSNETTPGNYSDSMRDATRGDNSSEHDEISISSHSSFLNNILNGTLNTSPSSESND